MSRIWRIYLCKNICRLGYTVWENSQFDQIKSILEISKWTEWHSFTRALPKNKHRLGRISTSRLARLARFCNSAKTLLQTKQMVTVCISGYIFHRYRRGKWLRCTSQDIFFLRHIYRQRKWLCRTSQDILLLRHRQGRWLRCVSQKIFCSKFVWPPPKYQRNSDSVSNLKWRQGRWHMQENWYMIGFNNSQANQSLHCWINS